MDAYSRLLIRMTMLLRRPPSRRRMAVMLAALGVALALVAVERWIGSPDWARLDRQPAVRVHPRG